MAMLNKKAAHGRYQPTSYASTSQPSAYSIANIINEEKLKIKDMNRRRRMLQSYNITKDIPLETEIEN